MAEEKKSFSDLLSEAPLATNEDTVTLVGSLARSREPNKFVLAMGQGNSVTLDVAAVKDYSVLGGSVGQQMVQLEVDKNQLPAQAQQAAADPAQVTTGIADIKHPPYETGIVDHKHPPFDKLPHFDKHPWLDTIQTTPFSDPPFALATAQQAPANFATPQAAFYTAPRLDSGARDKPPQADHTGVTDLTGPYDTGHWPWFD